MSRFDRYKHGVESSSIREHGQRSSKFNNTRGRSVHGNKYRMHQQTDKRHVEHPKNEIKGSGSLFVRPPPQFEGDDEPTRTESSFRDLSSYDKMKSDDNFFVNDEKIKNQSNFVERDHRGYEYESVLNDPLQSNSESESYDNNHRTQVSRGDFEDLDIDELEDEPYDEDSSRSSISKGFVQQQKRIKRQRQQERDRISFGDIDVSKLRTLIGLKINEASAIVLLRKHRNHLDSCIKEYFGENVQAPPTHQSPKKGVQRKRKPTAKKQSSWISARFGNIGSGLKTFGKKVLVAVGIGDGRKSDLQKDSHNGISKDGIRDGVHQHNKPDRSTKTIGRTRRPREQQKKDDEFENVWSQVYEQKKKKKKKKKKKQPPKRMEYDEEGFFDDLNDKFHSSEKTVGVTLMSENLEEMADPEKRSLLKVNDEMILKHKATLNLDRTVLDIEAVKVKNSTMKVSKSEGKVNEFTLDENSVFSIEGVEVKESAKESSDFDSVLSGLKIGEFHSSNSEVTVKDEKNLCFEKGTMENTEMSSENSNIVMKNMKKRENSNEKSFKKLSIKDDSIFEMKESEADISELDVDKSIVKLEDVSGQVDDAVVQESNFSMLRTDITVNNRFVMNFGTFVSENGRFHGKIAEIKANIVVLRKMFLLFDKFCVGRKWEDGNEVTFDNVELKSGEIFLESLKMFIGGNLIGQKVGIGCHPDLPNKDDLFCMTGEYSNIGATDWFKIDVGQYFLLAKECKRGGVPVLIIKAHRFELDENLDLGRDTFFEVDAHDIIIGMSKLVNINCKGLKFHARRYYDERMGLLVCMMDGFELRRGQFVDKIPGPMYRTRIPQFFNMNYGFCPGGNMYPPQQQQQQQQRGFYPPNQRFHQPIYSQNSNQFSHQQYYPQQQQHHQQQFFGERRNNSRMLCHPNHQYAQNLYPMQQQQQQQQIQQHHQDNIHKEKKMDGMIDQSSSEKVSRLEQEKKRRELDHKKRKEEFMRWELEHEKKMMELENTISRNKSQPLKNVAKYSNYVGTSLPNALSNLRRDRSLRKGEEVEVEENNSPKSRKKKKSKPSKRLKNGRKKGKVGKVKQDEGRMTNSAKKKQKKEVRKKKSKPSMKKKRLKNGRNK